MTRDDYDGSEQTTQTIVYYIVQLYAESAVLQSLHYLDDEWCERHTITIGVTLYDYKWEIDTMTIIDWRKPCQVEE